MEDTQPIPESPEILTENGKRTGELNKSKGVEYFRAIGKISAAKRNYPKEYYAELGRRSAQSRKRMREEKINAEKSKHNPIHIINNFLAGKKI